VAIIFAIRIFLVSSESEKRIYPNVGKYVRFCWLNKGKERPNFSIWIYRSIKLSEKFSALFLLLLKYVILQIMPMHSICMCTSDFLLMWNKVMKQYWQHNRTKIIANKFMLTLKTSRRNTAELTCSSTRLPLEKALGLPLGKAPLVINWIMGFCGPQCGSV